MPQIVIENHPQSSQAIMAVKLPTPPNPQAAQPVDLMPGQGSQPFLAPAGPAVQVTAYFVDGVTVLTRALPVPALPAGPVVFTFLG